MKPQLKTVPGVADIDSLGGYEKQYVVEPDTTKLVNYGLSYSDIARALQAANLAVGANYIQRGGEAYLVHADARIHSIDEIGRAVIATHDSVPVTINDVAKVRIGGQFRTGAASKNGQRSRDRHRADVDRRKQPHRRHGGSREIPGNSQQPAARHRRQRGARSLAARQCHDHHRRREPCDRCPARHRHAVLLARQCPCRHDRDAGHSVVVRTWRQPE